MAKILASTAHGVSISGFELVNADQLLHPGSRRTQPIEGGIIEIRPSDKGKPISATIEVSGDEDKMKLLKQDLPKILAKALPGATISHDLDVGKYDLAQYQISGVSMTKVAEALRDTKVFHGPTAEADAKLLCEAAKSVQAHVNKGTRASGWVPYHSPDQWEEAVKPKPSKPSSIGVRY